MTKNTLRFITPLKVCATKKSDKTHLEVDSENPATWTNEMLREWMQFQIKSLDVFSFCPFETGKQILSITDSEFISRLMSCHHSISEKKAKHVYDQLWKMFIDARSKNKYNTGKGWDKALAKHKAEKKKQDDLRKAESKLKREQMKLQNFDEVQINVQQ